MVLIGKNNIINPRAILLYKQSIQRPTSILYIVQVAVGSTNLIATHIEIQKFVILSLWKLDIIPIPKPLLQPPGNKPLHVIGMNTVLLILNGTQMISISSVYYSLLYCICQSCHSLGNDFRYLHYLIADQFFRRNTGAGVYRPMSHITQ